MNVCSVRGCSREALPGRKRCEYHRQKAQESYRRIRQGMTPERLAEYNAQARERMARNPEIRRRNAERLKQARREVVEHYGGKCACCGEGEYEFLTLHHFDGEGTKHRRELFGGKDVGGNAFAWKIRAMGFPPGLQVLCCNCHNAIHRYGNCPHQR